MTTESEAAARLAEHCDPEREDLSRPWSEAGRTCASQGHYLVGVPGEHAAPREAAPLASWIVEPPGREPDATMDWSRLAAPDMTVPCPRCDGRGRLRCEVCEGSGRHWCRECGTEHDCRCGGARDTGPCDCSNGRVERHDRLCLVAGMVLDLAWVVRLARALGAPVRAWALWDRCAVFLAGPEPPGARAVVMMRREPPSGVPDVMAVQVLLAIGETIGDTCSICRSRHGSEVRHACEP